MDRMCIDVAQPAGSVSLRWLIYSAAMEGAPYGMSHTATFVETVPFPDVTVLLADLALAVCSMAQKTSPPSTTQP
jgi:hypothetical protein